MYREEFVPLFELPTVNKKSYYDIDESYFLHVRRGDYLYCCYLNIDLKLYYRRALDKMASKGVAYVVSNDPAYCEEWSVLKDIRHRVIYENELDTLAIMKSCAKGGIAANSSFSWWGLYLDTKRQNLILPDTWYTTYENRHETESTRYRFPECSVVPV